MDILAPLTGTRLSNVVSIASSADIAGGASINIANSIPPNAPRPERLHDLLVFITLSCFILYGEPWQALLISLVPLSTFF
jgi:hypothetical protein